MNKTIRTEVDLCYGIGELFEKTFSLPMLVSEYILDCPDNVWDFVRDVWGNVDNLDDKEEALLEMDTTEFAKCISVESSEVYVNTGFSETGYVSFWIPYTVDVEQLEKIMK